MLAHQLQLDRHFQIIKQLFCSRPLAFPEIMDHSLLYLIAILQTDARDGALREELAQRRPIRNVNALHRIPRVSHGVQYYGHQGQVFRLSTEQ